MNTIFLALIPFIVSIVAARSYLLSGLNSLLFMGCGMIAFGCGSMLGGWLINNSLGPNLTVTIHNIGVLLGSIFSILGAISTSSSDLTETLPETRKLVLGIAYFGMVLLMVFVSLAAVWRVMPPFFIQGVGPTLLRQIVLGVAVLLFLLSALVYMRIFIKRETIFHYWHCLSLLMIAFGLIAIFVQKAVGSPIGWLGRSGQYIGCIYALTAILFTFKSARVQGMPFQNALAVLFRNAELSYHTLVETVMDPIISFEQDGVIIQWNSAAEKVFGYHQNEVIGASIFDLVITEEYLELFRKKLDILKESDDRAKIARLIEITVKTKCEDIIPVDVSISAINEQNKWTYICVFRDVAERTGLVAQIIELNEMLEQKVAERTCQLTASNVKLEQEIIERSLIEETLRESESRYRALFEAESDAIVLFDTVTGNIIDANGALLSLYGFNRTELPAIHYMDMSAEREESRQSFNFVLNASDQVVHVPERLHRKKDGTVFPVEINARSFVWDGHPVILGAIRDITQRKQAETAVREGDERFQHLIGQAPLPLCIVNKDKVITYMNYRFVELFGYTPEELPSLDDWWSFAYPDEDYRFLAKESWKAAVERAARARTDIEPIEYKVTCKDGTVRDVVISGIALHTDYLATFNDITQRNQAEKALRESEERLREVTENSLDAAYKRDLQTNTYEYLSPVFAQITGYPLDEFQNLSTETVVGLIYPDDHSQIESVIAESMSGDEGTFYKVNYRFKHKDGNYRWFRDQFIVKRDTQGKPTAWIGSVSDITERKQAEEALHESEQKYRTLFEAIPDTVFVIDQATGDILDVNPAATRTYGFERDEFIGKNSREVSAEPEKTASALEDSKTSIPLRYHYRKDGSVFPVEMTASTVDLQSTTTIICTARDITERRKAEEELKRLAERDHNIADVLQQIVMPPAMPTLPENYEIVAKYQPASHEADVCGDFCDIFDLGEGRIGISVGDIVGKGLLAAIRVTAAKNMIRNYAYLYDRPSKVMSLVNDALCRDIAMENDMLTAFFAILDTQDATLTYSNAGHEPPILWNDGENRPLKSGGPMFCGIRNQVYIEGFVSLQTGDTFVAVTDGITEASVDKRSEQFGVEGIIHCLVSNAESTSERIATVILENAKEFAKGDLSDDATVVVIKYS